MGLINAVRDLRTIKRLLTQAAAEAEARQAGQDRPGPEHLLLAATTLPDGTAPKALQHVGIDPQRLRAAIELVHTSALATVGMEVAHDRGAAAALRAPTSGVFRSTPQAQQVFQQAVALSKSTKPSQLLGAHVEARTR